MLDFRKMTAVLAACAVSFVTLFAAGTAAPVCAVIDAEDPYSYDVYYADSGLRMAVYHGAGYEDATWMDNQDADGDGVVNALDASYILLYCATIGAGLETTPEEILQPLTEGTDEITVQIDTIRIDPEYLEDNYSVPVAVRCVNNPGVTALEFGVKVDEACRYYPLDRGACIDLTGETPIITEDYFKQKGQLTWFGWAGNYVNQKVDLTARPFVYLNVHVPEDAQPGDVYEISFVKEATRTALWCDAVDHIDYTSSVEYINGAIIIETEETTEPETPPLGDVNLDGQVSVADVISVNKFYMKTGDLTETQQIAADCSHDGVVDLTDSLMILKSLIGLVTLS